MGDRCRHLARPRRLRWWREFAQSERGRPVPARTRDHGTTTPGRTAATGFSVACLRGVYGTQMANYSPTGQGDRAEHEGPVACDAHKFMPPRTEHHPHRVYEWGSTTTGKPGRELLLANVDCTLYLDSGTRQDTPAPIRQAFKTLATRRY